MKTYYYSILILLFPLLFNFPINGYSQPQSFTQIVETVKPAIVKIYAETNGALTIDMMAEVLTNDAGKFFSVGTGFIISKDGLIMTANHVISKATGPIKVFTSQSEEAASIVFKDSLADIAVIKINKSNCPFVQLLDPINVPMGTDLAFIGFPLNLDFPVVSKTILAAKTNAPIKKGFPSRHQLVINQFVNHGNSGGPLFLSATGQVIGVISWRPAPDYENRLIKLPKNYRPVVTLGDIDPIKLSVETYNENLKYSSEVSQYGIGFVPSVEYAKQFIK